MSRSTANGMASTGLSGGQRRVIHCSGGTARTLDRFLSRVYSRWMPADDGASSAPRRLTDPRTMRAVSHPVRLALIEVLTFHGPLTATEAGELIEESPTTCSFHLRQLARYGFVEEAGGGVGRARPWRVVRIGFETVPGGDDVAGEVAARVLSSAALRRQIDRHERSMGLRRSYPAEWRDAGTHVETVWWVTPAELTELEGEIESLVNRYRDRLVDPSRRPLEARPAEFIGLTHMFEPVPEAIESAISDREIAGDDGL